VSDFYLGSHMKIFWSLLDETFENSTKFPQKPLKQHLNFKVYSHISTIDVYRSVIITYCSPSHWHNWTLPNCQLKDSLQKEKELSTHALIPNEQFHASLVIDAVKRSIFCLNNNCHLLWYIVEIWKWSRQTRRLIFTHTAWYIISQNIYPSYCWSAKWAGEKPEKKCCNYDTLYLC
jgi:hypothetical protein